MATVTKRGSSWSVQIRRKGAPSQFRSFPTKMEAKAWAIQQEARIDQGDGPPPMRLLRATTLGDILDRYVQDVTPRKRSAETERLRLGKLRRDPICNISLAMLTSSSIADYRDRRLTIVKPATAARELALLHHALEIARKEWGFKISANPIASAPRIVVRNARERRLAEGEWERLDGALAKAINPLLRPIAHFAVETGMRRGEILKLRWRHVDFEHRTAHIPETKTGIPRTVPLTEGALSILNDRKMVHCDLVFPISSNAVRLGWARTVKRAGLVDLRFHDLRHEAISRFFEFGLSLPEVAVISGHRDPRMLFRYTHLRPADLAEKLARLMQSRGAIPIAPPAFATQCEKHGGVR